MQKDRIIEDILLIPEKYHTLNVSLIFLVNESGYSQHYSDISETDIYEALKQEPEIAKQWLSYSEDKRTSLGWYLQQAGRGYYVGSLTEKSGSVLYPNLLEACAAYIKKEIEGIRSRNLPPAISSMRK